MRKFVPLAPAAIAVVNGPVAFIPEVAAVVEEDAVVDEATAEIGAVADADDGDAGAPISPRRRFIAFRHHCSESAKCVNRCCLHAENICGLLSISAHFGAELTLSHNIL